MASLERLKLGKGASFFVKAQLRRLRQENDTWEADFFPIPCSDSEHEGVWWGIVLSHEHDKVLAQRMVEEPPTVNDLANLLAEAMQEKATSCQITATTRPGHFRNWCVCCRKRCGRELLLSAWSTRAGT